MKQSSHILFRERLWPSPLIFLALTLLLPAVSLVVMPINSRFAIPIAIVVFGATVTALLLLSPVVQVTDKFIQASAAQLPHAFVGEVRVLSEQEFAQKISTQADARAFLVIRGDVRKGVMIENTDTNDPAPYWIIASRKPKSLAASIQTASSEIRKHSD